MFYGGLSKFGSCLALQFFLGSNYNKSAYPVAKVFRYFDRFKNRIFKKLFIHYWLAMNG